jgi:hypothetical protein
MRRLVLAPAMLACSCALVSGLSEISVTSSVDGSVTDGGSDGMTTIDGAGDSAMPDVATTGDGGQGYALDFENGACAGSQLGYSFSGSPFTVELWWKPGTPSITNELKPLVYNGGRTAMEAGWALGLSGFMFEFCVSDGATIACATAQTANLIGHLIHIAAVSSVGGGMRSLQLWMLDWTMGQKNHTMAGSNASAPVSWSTNVSFSVSGVASGMNCLGTLPGVVDDLRLWSRALASQDLDQGFMQTIGCGNVTLAGLYTFDEGMGSVAASVCGNKANLFIGTANWLLSPFP